MAEYKISINQLATFSKVSEARKKAIVKQKKSTTDFGRTLCYGKS